MPGIIAVHGRAGLAEFDARLEFRIKLNACDGDDGCGGAQLPDSAQSASATTSGEYSIRTWYSVAMCRSPGF